jgi:hypothetical protein
MLLLMYYIMHGYGTHNLPQNFYFAYSGDQCREFPAIAEHGELFTTSANISFSKRVRCGGNYINILLFN